MDFCNLTISRWNIKASFLDNFSTEPSSIAAFHIFQTLDRCFDCFKVGQHTTQPTLINVWHTCTVCFSSDQVTGLTLWPPTIKMVPRLADNWRMNFIASDTSPMFFQVHDMNLVAMTEDVRCHLWDSKTSLVTKMNTSFQHFTHCYRHNNQWLGLESCQ